MNVFSISNFSRILAILEKHMQQVGTKITHTIAEQWISFLHLTTEWKGFFPVSAELSCFPVVFANTRDFQLHFVNL